jgi:hypothetical protein
MLKTLALDYFSNYIGHGNNYGKNAQEAESD